MHWVEAMQSSAGLNFMNTQGCKCKVLMLGKAHQRTVLRVILASLHALLQHMHACTGTNAPQPPRIDLFLVQHGTTHLWTKLVDQPIPPE